MNFFKALFRSADQVYFLRYKHANSATVILLWYAGLFTRSDLDRRFMRLQSTHIRTQTFWDNLNYNQGILFQIFW